MYCFKESYKQAVYVTRFQMKCGLRVCTSSIWCCCCFSRCACFHRPITAQAAMLRDLFHFLHPRHLLRPAYRRLDRQYAGHRRGNGRPAGRPGSRRSGGADRRPSPLLAGRHDGAELHGVHHRRGSTRRPGAQHSGQTRAAGRC